MANQACFVVDDHGDVNETTFAQFSAGVEYVRTKIVE
jgi:hypothetical protein